MLRNGNQTTAKDAIFGDFSVVDYPDIDTHIAMVTFFLDLWRKKGGEAKTISRADIRPAEMKKYLEHIVLLDVIRRDTSWSLLVRLIGGHVADFYGEITGKDVRDMINTKAIERIYHVCGRILERAEPILTVSPAFSPDHTYMEAIALYMPLFDKNAAIDKIMVAVHVSTPGQP